MAPPNVPEITVILPVLDEEGLIGSTIDRIVEELGKAGISVEILIVDDGSTDRTWHEIARIAERVPIVRAIRFTRNFGKESAIRAGLEHATGHLVLVMDADEQHPVALIPKMVDLIRTKGADIVEAVKDPAHREPGARRATSGLFYWILARLSGWDLEGSSDFKLLSRRVVDALLSMRERNSLFRGLSTWTGYRREQLVFEVPDRRVGVSKFGTIRLTRLAVRAMISFSSKPLQLVTITAVIFAVFALALTARALYLKWIGRAVEGFTTVIIADLIIGSCVMFSLGLIGLYLAQIYDELKGRPSYLALESIRVERRSGTEEKGSLR